MFFKYLKIFQCHDGSEFKSEVIYLLEKHNVKIDKATTKHKHTNMAFVEAFNMELVKKIFKVMNVQEFEGRDIVSTIWLRKLENLMTQK